MSGATVFSCYASLTTPKVMDEVFNAGLSTVLNMLAETYFPSVDINLWWAGPIIAFLQIADEAVDLGDLGIGVNVNQRIGSNSPDVLSEKSLDIFAVERSGAGQVVLLGTPNVGKSAVVAATTKAKVQVTDYPFATAGPVPAGR